MNERKEFTYEELVDQGRRLLDARDVTCAHREFVNWDRNVAVWLDEQYPGTGASAEWSSQPDSVLVVGGHYYEDANAWSQTRRSVRFRLGWLARFATTAKRKQAVASRKPVLPGSRVFVVHGHDEARREAVARFLERLNLEPVILHERPDKGRTIIEKFTDNADVSFAVVLLTADDVGSAKGAPHDRLEPRARQNVILELGYFLGRLGRDRVCALYEEGVDIPSDYQGVLFVPLQAEWRLRLARELKAAGLPVDMNQAV
ncbi:MAG: nucleotide-binding protein [Phycisphaerales bacterium]|nr:nucleotide-binding protein [Phycisphaerales bacterium]